MIAEYEELRSLVRFFVPSVFFLKKWTEETSLDIVKVIRDSSSIRPG
jgi:hypothetical protein